MPDGQHGPRTASGEMDRLRGRCAGDYLRELGARVDVIDTGGFPHGARPLRCAIPSLPTVTVYNHLDVQPADGPEWKTPPFTFTRDGRSLVRARHDRRQGAGADRALRRAAGAGDRTRASTSSSCGSWRRRSAAPTSQPAWRRDRRRRGRRPPFTTDSVVVSDTIWTAAGQPSISVRPARADGLHHCARRPAPRTSTRGRPAARRATRSASWPRSSPSATTRAPGR